MSQTVHTDSESALIHLAPDLRCRPLCHECLEPARTVHSKGHFRMIRDLPMGGREVWLQVEYRKIWCDHCGGVRVEHLDFCDASQRVTTRLAWAVHTLCQILTNKAVAEHFNLHPTTVKNIDKAFLEQTHGQTDYDGLRILAMDEIAIKKGHHYLTVVLDYLSGRVVWMGPGRDKETLDAFFAGMTEAQKNAIEAVAIDMWEPFINRIRHHCPQARIVFDFFHVVQAYGKVIDEIRREEYRKASQADRDVIKGSRYLLLKNAQNLTDGQRPRLQHLLETNQTLNAVYILKDQLKLIFHYSDPGRVKQTLDDWCAMAQTLDHPELNRFIKRLRFFEYGLLNHADYPISTSSLEGSNNKIKVIKRMAYGYHDTDYFILKVKQAFDKRAAC